MSLRIIYGRAGSGKSQSCLDFVEKIIGSEAVDVIFIVPEQYSLQTERKLAQRLGGIGSRVDVLSFERLTQRVFSQVGPVYRTYVSDSGKQMLMQRALLKVKSSLVYLTNALETEGFCGLLLETINEFIRHNVTPSILAKAANNASGVMALKLADLSLIYEEYKKLFEYPMADSEDDPSLLLEKIKSFDLFRDIHIVIDSFTGFSPKQLAVIEELMLRARCVTVSLTTDNLDFTDNISDIFYGSKKTVRKLFELAVKNNIEIMPNVYLDGCKKYADNPELAHLESNYFRYPARLYEMSTENLMLFKANNYYGEVESAARHIVRLCREGKYRFREIAVITKALDTYAPLVRHIFSEFDILYNLDEKIYAASHSFTHAALTVFEIIIHNYSFDAIFSWLKSPYCNIDENEICILENYVLACGNTAKMWKNPQDWTFIPSGFDEELLSKINKIKNKARKPIISFADKFSGRKTAAEISTAFAEFLEESGAQTMVESLISEYTLQGHIVDSSILSSAWNAVISCLDEIVATLGDEKLSFEKYLAIFKEGLKGYEIGHIPPTVDEVLISGVDRFLGQDIKCVFVLGTSNGVFPESYTNEGLLSDTDRHLLAEQGAPLAEDTNVKQAGENYVIYSALTSPLQKLYLYYPIADSDGKAVYPSPIIERIKSVFPNVRQDDNIFEKDDILREIEGVTPSFNIMLLERDKFKEVAAWFKKNMPQRYAAAASAHNYTNLPQTLTKEAVSLLYGKAPKGSISRAELFGKCRYAYFLRYGLFAKEREKHNIEPRDAGSFMHEIIEEFSKFGVECGWSELTKPICDKKVAEITKSVLEKYLGEVYTLAARFNFISKKVVRIMSTAAWSIAEFYKKSGFVPLGYEIAFDRDGDFPPIEVDAGGIKIVLRGKVDRADILRTESGNYISIVDYKSSYKNISFAEILCGVQIQLPTYIKAVCEAISQKEGVRTMPAAMLYYRFDMPVITADRSISDEEIWQAVQKSLRMQGLTLETENVSEEINSVFAVKSLATSQQLDKICKTAYSKLKDAFTQILNGRIDLNPVRISGEAACRYCPYGSVCGFDVSLSGNKYRNIKNIDREEFFNHVGKMDDSSARGN